MTEAWGPDDDEPRRHSGPVRVRVPAKINLHLGVGPLRPDGYHELNTVYHAISLFDELTARAGDTLTLTMEGEGTGTLALDETNLIIRAARALSARCRVPSSAKCASSATDQAGRCSSRCLPSRARPRSSLRPAGASTQASTVARAAAVRDPEPTPSSTRRGAGGITTTSAQRSAYQSQRR